MSFVSENEISEQVTRICDGYRRSGLRNLDDYLRIRKTALEEIENRTLIETAAVLTEQQDESGKKKSPSKKRATVSRQTEQRKTEAEKEMSPLMREILNPNTDRRPQADPVDVKAQEPVSADASDGDFLDDFQDPWN